MGSNSLIFTEKGTCQGCNKCIFKCPVNANEAIWENEQNKIIIKDDFCIACGECVNICDHEARAYNDDTERFFEDLKKGLSISLIAAPAARTNFKNIKKVFGFLKSCGVNLIYDVSFGADICTWGYIRAIEQKNLKTLIAQPCPVVVTYIERFHPSLTPYLSPIQSPAICTAIYLQEYKNARDTLAFFSPCVGKKAEFSDIRTHNRINYNVTYASFLKYIEEHNINIDEYEDVWFDNAEGSWGFAFSRPGGLAENVKFYLNDDIWIKTVEGINIIEKYFKEYEQDLVEGNPVPLLIDALNCEHGCNIGTGTTKLTKQNTIDYLINENKKNVSKEHGKNVLEYFDKTLCLDDFIREYQEMPQCEREISETELEDAFLSLGKFREEDRNINCFSCGYGNCALFAMALARGRTHQHNCRQFTLDKVKYLSLSDELTGVRNRHSYKQTLDKFEQTPPHSIGILYVDINELKVINDTKGHKFGDRLIVILSMLLRRTFLNNVYRMGGDEFLVLDEEIGKEEFESKVSKFIKHVSAENGLNISIGTTWTDDCVSVLKQIEIADSKMYMDKQNYYIKHGTSNVKYKDMLSETLNTEIKENRFLVYLQPQICMRTNKVAGAEALVRKLDSSGIIQSPFTFIPFYEKEGIIPLLDFHVFEMVCQYIKNWENSPVLKNVSISVNFSRISFKASDTIDKIRNILEKYKIDVSKIVIEITESIKGMNDSEIRQLVKKFKAEGFIISLDDFGMGHSNLSMLAKSNFDEVKIDKSLVDDITTDKKTKVLVEHVLNVCHDLGIPTTLAEGIEYSEQLEVLKGMKCDKGQGYYFDKPMSVSDFNDKYWD